LREVRLAFHGLKTFANSIIDYDGRVADYRAMETIEKPKLDKVIQSVYEV